jgi:hypothetical protein
MRRPILQKYWVVDGEHFWPTVAKAGLYKLQRHDDSENLWNYKFRIIETRFFWPSRIVATANAPEEIALDWEYFTSQKWP